MKTTIIYFSFFVFLSSCELLEDDFDQINQDKQPSDEEKIDFENSPEPEFECIFSYNETFPEPSSGLRPFMEKLKSNLNRPDNSCIEGRVYLGFRITSEGQIEDIFVIRGIHPTYDKAAILAFKKTCSQIRWNPGGYSGVPVSFRIVIPIQFGNS